MQHLHFTLRAMTGDQADAVVIRLYVTLGVQRAVCWLQVQDARLQLVQQRRLRQPGRGVDKHIDPVHALPVQRHVVKVVQQVQVIATLFAPRGQQWVACRWAPAWRLAGGAAGRATGHGRPRCRPSNTDTGFAPASAPGRPGPVAPAPRPFASAGTKCQTPPGAAASPPGVGPWPGIAPSASCSAGHEAGVHAGARGIGQLGSHIGAQVAPQLGLPGVGVWQHAGLALVVTHHVVPGFAGRPVRQPVGPVALVGVEDIGHLQRQLVAACGHRRRCPGSVAAARTPDCRPPARATGAPVARPE